MKKITIIILLAVLNIFAVPTGARAYNYDYNGDILPSQAGYVPERIFTGLNEPSDIFYFDNYLYVADSGNNRILVLDLSLNIIDIYDNFILPDKSISELNNPHGIYLSDKYIYIADTGNNRIIISDYNANIISEITQPDTPLYDKDKIFSPEKITADKAGNIYIIAGNITSGCMMFSPDGEFMGYYGANRSVTTLETIRNYFTSENKKLRLKRNIPASVDSFDISGDFIYTCTKASRRTENIVRKLNPAGCDIFAERGLHFGDYQPKKKTSGYREPSICDIDISENENILCLDSVTGHIFEYDREGNLLFITGNISGQSGGFKNPVAIESAGNNIYVLDSGKNNITVFRETEFGSYVHKAVDLFNGGYYSESLSLWHEVLRRDGNYTYAYTGVAYALLRNGNYTDSMKYARLAGDSELYNKAFQEYRRIFVKKYAGYILIFIILIILIYKGVKSLVKIRTHAP